MRTRHSIPRDLFGKRRRVRRTRLEAGLARYDQETFDERLDRLKWVEQIFPRGFFFTLPPETFFVFSEAKDSFINGQPIAAVMLAGAFIEHVLTIELDKKGFHKEARGGMRSILRCLENNRAAITPLLKRIDDLQEIRNPYVHLKPYAHPALLSQRSWKVGRRDYEVLEEDAKSALSLMYTVATVRVW